MTPAPFVRPAAGSALPIPLGERYRPVERSVRAGERTFRLLAVPDLNALVDAIDPAAFAADERLPYWADIWTSGVALAAFCLRTPELRGARVLELGCGLGLAGIAAATAGASVTMTDVEPDALVFAQCNAERNVPPGEGDVRVRLLDWRDPEAIGPFDWILGADVAYERPRFPALLHTVDLLLAGRGTAVFTDPDRATGAAFAAAAGAAGFAVTAVRELAPPHDAVTTVVRYMLRRGGRP